MILLYSPDLISFQLLHFVIVIRTDIQKWGDVKCIWDKPRGENLSKPCRVKEICTSYWTLPLMPNQEDYQLCPTLTPEIR